MGVITATRRSALIATAATAFALVTGPALPPEPAAAAPDKRVERVARSEAPGPERLVQSVVRLHAPLPEAAGDHPRRCDGIRYLRYRDAAGPRVPARADAVFVAMPGIFGGASTLDQVGRHVVRLAARRGASVEFWALDRRANCIEDHRGVRAAARARDAKVAFDYYWGDREIEGKRFGGFKDAGEAQFLSEVGLEQTVRDMYAVIRNRIREPRTRRSKVFCGGHSLGGPLTTAFAGWDFDGDPDTQEDAGYMQCAGFFGFDTSLGFGESSGSSPVGAASAFAAASEGSPYLVVPPFTPETIQLIGPLGVAAYHSPQRTDVVGQSPRTPMIELSQRMLFSRDAVNFATGEPNIRDFNFTNETILAGIFDDNSNPVTILRASLGTVEGGPVAQKDFPLPGHFGLSAPLLDNDFLIIPSEPETPLYQWRGYDRMGAPGVPVQTNRAGQPVTSEKSEVADLREFARTLFEPPADFVEQYFPTRILTDVMAAEEGDRSGSLSNLRYDGIAERPAFLIQAGDSAANSGAEPAITDPGEPPNDDPRSGVVVLPGYNHLDVTVAAWRQNSTGPEHSSNSLVSFALKVLED